MWNSGGCSSWYLDEHGKNTVLWGGYTWQYWRATRSVKPEEYQFLGVGTGSRAKRRRWPLKADRLGPERSRWGAVPFA